QLDEAAGLGRAVEGRRVVAGDVVGAGAARVGARRQVGRRDGRCGGVDRDRQRAGGRAGVAGDVGRLGADRVVAVCERRRRDRVGARGAAVVAGGVDEELDAGAVLGRAGEARRRVAGAVVVGGGAAVVGGRQVGRRGRGRGGGVDRDRQRAGGRAGVAGEVG